MTLQFKLSDCFFQENRTLDTSMMDLAEGLKNVTVVQVKALIPQNIMLIKSRAIDCSHVGSNFKKFRKVCYPLMF